MNDSGEQAGNDWAYIELKHGTTSMLNTVQSIK